MATLGRGFCTPHLTLSSESDVLFLHCETENGDEISPTGMQCIYEWYGMGKGETTNLYPGYHHLSCQILPVMNIIGSKYLKRHFLDIFQVLRIPESSLLGMSFRVESLRI